MNDKNNKNTYDGENNKQVLTRFLTVLYCCPLKINFEAHTAKKMAVRAANETVNEETPSPFSNRRIS